MNLINASKSRISLLSTIISSNPFACLLSANGSAEPLGILPKANEQMILSILSDIEIIFPPSVLGCLSFANLGYNAEL